MKAVIINGFDTYKSRVEFVKEYLTSKGYEVTIIQSDYSHFHKTKILKNEVDIEYVDALPYKRNLSVNRLRSHYKFAKDAFDLVENIEPDLLYTLIPPNTLAKFSAAYKKQHSKVRLVMDLIDLWPETMPISIKKSVFPLSLWGKMRDNYLQYSDLIITECDLYQEVLEDVLKNLRVETVYLAKSKAEVTVRNQLDEDKIQLAYLGSINNIIDISKISKIIETIIKIKPVTLNIVGDGEKKEEFISAIESIGAEVVFHGKIFDPIQKQKIFDRCHYGLNVMKSSVCVGLTMKSIDYFQHGLPIINNIPADTARLVEEYSVGINILSEQDISEKINENAFFITAQNKKNASRLFKEKFSTEAFYERMNEIFFI